MLDRVRDTLRRPIGTLPTLRSRPYVLLHSLRSAALSWLVLAAVLSSLLFVLPAVRDDTLQRIFPEQGFMERVGGLFQGEGRDARRETASRWFTALAWLSGSLTVLAFFWADLPRGVERARLQSRKKEELAARIAKRSVGDSLALYRQALRLATEPGRISEIERRIQSLAPGALLSHDGALAGRYEILELVSRGGNGVVYRAKDLTLDRVIALKELATAVVTEEDRARFLQEAQALARLSHPHIVQVYDLFEHQNRMWIAMEFVEGGTLNDLIARRGRIEALEAVNIASKLAAALDFAHGRGIIHRDLKAMNVLLTEAGEPRVADFGTAKLASSSLQTLGGTILGSPHSMSPEQASGEAVDERSDVYSLGVVLYQMLLGRPPFTGDTMEVIAQHVQAAPPAVDQQEDSPDMPESLATLVMQMLSKDPEQRPSGMDVVSASLERVLANETVPA